MELKTKYQYTYFIHPYLIDETKYDTYILKLLKDKKCNLKFFEKEKDLDIYNFFLPNIRDYMFQTFELRDEKLNEFKKMKIEQKKKCLLKNNVIYFTYNLGNDIQGKVNIDEGIFFKVESIEIICFNTGICFFIMKTHIENNLHIIDKFKYSKLYISNTNSNIICSGTDTYNYTKLPFEYENQYFYTYILLLYEKLFLTKLNLDFKKYDKIIKMKDKFIKFTKEIWNKEITMEDTGIFYYKMLKDTLQLKELYKEIQNKYEIIYKDLNIERNNIYYKLIVILLIFSLILNTINIIALMFII